MPNQHALFVAAAAVIGLACGVVRGNDFNPVVQSGAAVPGQDTSFSIVNLVGVDTSHGSAFIGTFSVGGQTYSGLYRTLGGQIIPLADRGTPGPAGEGIRTIIGTGDFENGAIVFAAETTAGRALYRYSPGGGLSALVRQGDVLPGSLSPIDNFGPKAIAGDAANFSFSGPRQDETYAMYSSVDSSPVLLADNKTRAPIAEMGYFIDFPELHYRGGLTAFVGRGKDPDDPTARPEPAGVFVQSPGNPLEIVGGRMFEIPGGNGKRFVEFEKPRVMPDGRVAFTGGFIDEYDPSPDPERHLGLFIRNGDLTWKKYIDTDMVLPGLRSAIREFNGYSIEGRVNIFGIEDIDLGTYIYFESSEGVFTHLVDSYGQLDGKQLVKVKLAGDTAIDNVVWFNATFADGSSAVYSALVPEPATAITLAALAAGCLIRRPRRRAGLCQRNC